MILYVTSGHAYLVCPRLIEADSRHGEHWTKGPACRRGGTCPIDHDHEPPLVDGAGHSANDFYWTPGARPPTPDEAQVCGCGETLVWADLDDLYGQQHLGA